MTQGTFIKEIIKRSLAGSVLLAISITLRASADYSSTVLSQGPVGYWRLNETTAPPVPLTTATNSGNIGTPANGVYTNGAIKGVGGALVGEPANKAAAFNGFVTPGNRIRVPYRPEWNVNGPFSVELWAKPGQTDSLLCPAASVTFTPDFVRSGWLLYQGDSTAGTGNGWYFRLYRGESGLATRNASVTLSLSTNSWYHIVGSFDGTNINLY